LALGPTLETATAHNPGKLEEHCGTHQSANNGVCPLPRGETVPNSCTTKSGATGVLHFVDIDSNGIHDHDSPGPNGEPKICMRSR